MLSMHLMVDVTGTVQIFNSKLARIVNLNRNLKHHNTLKYQCGDPLHDVSTRFSLKTKRINGEPKYPKKNNYLLCEALSPLRDS